MTATDDDQQMVGIPDTLQHLAVPINDLQPYYKNARRNAGELINSSLRMHGQYRPLVVNRGTLTGRRDEILAGNGTWQEAQHLGWSMIAVTYVDVSDDSAARIVLVDNKANDEAGYDDRLLAELLGSLPDLQGTGFENDELDDILAGLATPGLDDLLDRVGSDDGDGDDPDLWPVLRLSIPSGVLAKWKDLVQDRGGNEAKVFSDLIGYEGTWL